MSAPVITAQLGTPATGAAEVQAALHAGAEVLAALKGAGPVTELKIPAALLEQLAGSVVKLASAVLEMKGQTPPTVAQVNAQISVTSVYGAASNQHEHLSALATKTRLRAIDLGMNVKVELGLASGYWPWVMSISGQAPKEKLESLRSFVAAELGVAGGGSIGKISVDKYEAA